MNTIRAIWQNWKTDSSTVPCSEKINKETFSIVMRKLALNGSILQIPFYSEYEASRVCQILNSIGIKTIADLCQMSRGDLRSIDQIGDCTLCTIETALAMSDLHLGMTEKELASHMPQPCGNEMNFNSLEEALEALLGASGKKTHQQPPLEHEKTPNDGHQSIVMVFVVHLPYELMK